MNPPSGVPLPAARRLPLYLRILKERAQAGEVWASSDAIAERLGLSAVQVRKDLSAVGALGSPKRGFPVAETIGIVESFLGVDDLADVFLIGSGQLASAILSDEGIAKRGFKIVALFDPDEAREGQTLGGMSVFSLSRLSDLSRRMNVKLVILAVTGLGVGPSLQAIASSALTGVLDLSGSGISFPPTLTVVREDYGAKLSVLAGSLVRS